MKTLVPTAVHAFQGLYHTKVQPVLCEPQSQNKGRLLVYFEFAIPSVKWADG